MSTAKKPTGQRAQARLDFAIRTDKLKGGRGSSKKKTGLKRYDRVGAYYSKLGN